VDEDSQEVKGRLMFELSVLGPEPQVETISEALEALDALSVSVEDADAATPAEQALFGEPDMPPPKAGWERSVIKALFATREAARSAESTLVCQDFFVDCKSLGLHEIADQDWVRLTQSQFTPVEITPEFWIVPTWHEKPAGATKVITLDPGLAFGTGTHPTTRMCLRWIARHEAVLHGQRVLDYGCGSGILAVGAALHGAGLIDAVDIDEAALQSTIDNALANQVLVNTGLPNQVSKELHSYTVVLANILATPLKVLAPLLTGHVSAGGHLVLAGILERQEDDLKAAYASYAKLEVSDREDGWILMTALV
jgi:ribosomal protein L11 methyltransferase